MSGARGARDGRGLRCAVGAFVAFVTLCATLAGCGRSAAQAGGAEGNIRVSGAWALYPLMVRWAEEYQRLHPGVRIDVSAGGAGKGIADALAGLVNIGMVSREIRPEETAKGAAHVAVAIDAVFATANASNAALTPGFLARGVRKATLAGLWVGGRGASWREITGEASADAVQVYTRSDSCGAAETWARYLGGKGQESLRGVGVYGDPGVAEAVKGDPRGIGYNNLNFAFDPRTGAPVAGLVVLPIDANENGRIDPQERVATRREAIGAVRSGAYPSPPARTLYLVTRGRFDGPAKAFVRWILSDGQRLVDEAGYVALSEDALSIARASLNP